MSEVYKVKNRKWGVGSAALFLSIFATSFSFTYIYDDISIGGHIFRFFNLNIPPIVGSLVLYFIALYIGIKYKENYGAKAGKVISIIFLSMFLLAFLIGFISQIS